METFSALLALFAGNPPVTGEFPPQRPVPRSSDVYLICAVQKRLSKPVCDRAYTITHVDREKKNSAH